MDLETIELLTDWTNGTAVPAYGVNALLAGIPRSAGHPLPAPLTVVSELTHGWVAREQAPSGELLNLGPLLALSVFGPTNFEPAVYTNTHLDGEVDVMFRLLNVNVNSHHGVRDGRYYTRALRRSLIGFMRNESDEYRTKNGILVYELARLRAAKMFSDEQDNPISIGTVATFRARDDQPLP